MTNKGGPLPGRRIWEKPEGLQSLRLFPRVLDSLKAEALRLFCFNDKAPAPRKEGRARSQKRMRSSIYLRRSAMATRSCCMVSRSRTVTVWVASVSKSTQMAKGVPISSWRR